MNKKFRNPEAGQSTKPNVSTDLQYMMKFQFQKLGSNVNEQMDLLAKREQTNKEKTSFFNVLIQGSKRNMAQIKCVSSYCKVWIKGM